MTGESAGGRSIKAAVSHLCSLAVAAFFIYAAWDKIDNPRQFAIDIGNYRMMPTWSLNTLALLMPWWEVGAAVSLIVPMTRRAGAMMITGLLLLFIFAVAYAVFHLGLDIQCGCTGANSDKAGWSTIGRNVLLLLATWAGIYLLPRRANRSV